MLREDSDAFLVPGSEFNEEMESCILANHEQIFNMMLNNWYRDESLWPEGRNYVMFKSWFDVEFHSLVIDLGEEEIIAEPFS